MKQIRKIKKDIYLVKKTGLKNTWIFLLFFSHFFFRIIKPKYKSPLDKFLIVLE